MDLKKLSNEELSTMREKLVSESDALRAKLKAVMGEINCRGSEQKLKSVLESLTPAERASLQVLAAKGIGSEEKFGKVGG